MDIILWLPVLEKAYGKTPRKAKISCRNIYTAMKNYARNLPQRNT